jgi:hypothetical protein
MEKEAAGHGPEAVGCEARDRGLIAMSQVVRAESQAVMSSAEASLRSVAKVADCIIGGAMVLCIAILLYFAYYYGWTHPRYATSPGGPMLYYLLPSMLAGLLCESLLLKPSYRINLALLLASTALALSVAEQALARFDRHRGGEVQLARAFGVEFDTRSVPDVIGDLNKQQIRAVPHVFPRALLQRQADGGLRSRITVNGTETLPLGGIAKRWTILCNDGGEYMLYEGDEHGFHNPPGLWRAGRLDVVAIGDSFVNGACVPSEKNFVALLRTRYPLTLNLGQWGNGPLLELATLTEYVPPLRPNILLWFYFEGNDAEDLRREREAPLLMSYLGEGFSQGLRHRQGEIDRVVIPSVERWMQAEISRRRFQHLTASLKLWHVRGRLGLTGGGSQEGPASGPALDLELFGRILVQAQALVDTWQGRLYFVYLPEVARYASPEHANKDRDRVLALVRALGIPLIDIHARLQAHRDPLAAFPFRQQMHFNEEGHRLVAEEVLRSLSPSDQAASLPADFSVRHPKRPFKRASG